MTSISQLKYLGFKVGIAHLFSLPLCDLHSPGGQEQPLDRADEKATGFSTVFTLEMGRMALYPQSKEEETWHKCWLWGARAEFRGKKSTALRISIEKAFGKKGPKLWNLGV